MNGLSTFSARSCFTSPLFSLLTADTDIGGFRGEELYLDDVFVVVLIGDMERIFERPLLVCTVETLVMDVPTGRPVLLVEVDEEPPPPPYVPLPPLPYVPSLIGDIDRILDNLEAVGCRLTVVLPVAPVPVPVPALDAL